MKIPSKKEQMRDRGAGKRDLGHSHVALLSRQALRPAARIMLQCLLRCCTFNHMVQATSLHVQLTGSVAAVAWDTPGLMLSMALRMWRIRGYVRQSGAECVLCFVV